MTTCRGCGEPQISDGHDCSTPPLVEEYPGFEVSKWVLVDTQSGWCIARAERYAHFAVYWVLAGRDRYALQDEPLGWRPLPPSAGARAAENGFPTPTNTATPRWRTPSPRSCSS